MKKNRKAIQWLYEEMPSWVGEGLISQDSADKISAHYGPLEKGGAARTAIITISIFATLMIGGGIVLVLGHNWDQLSKFARTAISFCPLLAGLVFCGWTLVKDKGAGLKEPAAVFLSLGLLCCLSLIGQIYQTGGDVSDLLFLWMLLAWPLIYIMGSSAAAGICLCGLAGWAGSAASGHLSLWKLVLLAALLIPHILSAFRDDRYSFRSVALGWISVASSAFIVGALVSDFDWWRFWPVAFCSLFSFFYALGFLFCAESPAAWRNPFRTAGAAAVSILCLILSFKWIWREVLGSHYGYDHGIWKTVASAPTWGMIIFGALLMAAPVLVLIFGDKRRMEGLLFGSAGAVAAFAFFMPIFAELPWLAALLFTALLAISCLTSIIRGARTGSLGLINCGMLLGAALILCRFFEMDTGYLVKGLAFIGAGIVLLVVNLVMVRKRAFLAQTEREGAAQ